MPSTDLRVKELLKERGWTTKILAEKTGMSESYLTHIKNGTRRWNEDSLRKIATAFSIQPIFLLSSCKHKEEKWKTESELLSKEVTKTRSVKVKVKKIPMVGEIPSYPSPYNNKTTQVTTGFKEMFVPFVGIDDDGLFAYVVDNQKMAPKFLKGDCLIISPSTEVKSGDIAAVEYKTDKVYKKIMVVTLSGNFIMLESVNHKNPPVAILKGKNPIKIIGKVIYTYQKYP